MKSIPTLITKLRPVATNLRHNKGGFLFNSAGGRFEARYVDGVLSVQQVLGGLLYHTEASDRVQDRMEGIPPRKSKPAKRAPTPNKLS